MQYLLLVIIVIILIVSLCGCKHKQHKVKDTFDPLTKIKPLHEYADDNLFADVVVYDNNDDRAGLDKCLEYCDGTCVEFGPTGIGQCFPKKKSLGKNYFTVMRNYEDESENIDKAAEQFIFPSLR